MTFILLNILLSWLALNIAAAFYLWVLADKRNREDHWQHLHPGMSPDWRRQW